MLITRVLLRILTEHIETKNSSDSKLFLVSICSIGILAQTRFINLFPQKKKKITKQNVYQHTRPPRSLNWRSRPVFVSQTLFRLFHHFAPVALNLDLLAFVVLEEVNYLYYREYTINSTFF